MMQRIEAIFENGLLRPMDPVKLHEGQQVVLLISRLDQPPAAARRSPSLHPKPDRQSAIMSAERNDGSISPETEDIRLMLDLCDRP